MNTTHDCPMVFPEVAVEDEIAAMASVVDAFGTLDAAARQRVLRWANDRWGMEQR